MATPGPENSLTKAEKHWRFSHVLLRFCLDTLLLLLVGSFASNWLIRWAPGADMDSRELTPGMSAGTIEALRSERARNLSFTGSSLRYFGDVLRGDFGNSLITGAPVAGLLQERVKPTAFTVAAGACLGLLLGVISAALGTFWFRRGLSVVTSTGFLFLLSIPAGLMVLLAIFGRVPVQVAVGAAVAPRIYFYALRLLSREQASIYVLNATAAGISRLRIALFHVLPVLQPEFAALAGFAVVSGLAATIPAEVLTGQPGLGKLAWDSVQQRDLPVLVAVTMCMVIFARAVTILTAAGRNASGRTTAQ